MFETCDRTICNTQPAQPLQCYFCDSTQSCVLENLQRVSCDKNVNQTYQVLSNFYQNKYEINNAVTKYECLSLKTELTGKDSSKLIYKGCVQQGFKACDLTVNSANSKEEDKKCYTCSTPLCNGSLGQHGSLLIALGVILGLKVFY